MFYLFKCNPSILSKQFFYRLTDLSKPRCYIHLRWSCYRLNLDYMHFSRNLHVSYVHLNRNLHVHYVHLNRNLHVHYVLLNRNLHVHYVHLNRNLHIHYVHLNRNLHVHYVLLICTYTTCKQALPEILVVDKKGNTCEIWFLKTALVKSEKKCGDRSQLPGGDFYSIFTSISGNNHLIFGTVRCSIPHPNQSSITSHPMASIPIHL